MRMTTGRRAVLALAVVIGGVAAGTVYAQDDLQARSRDVAMEFQNRLRSQLVTALTSGGPLLALPVCKEAAPAIAAEMGARTGAKIWRVSLRTRNPRGEPDAWERATLEQFNARRAAGEDPAGIEAFTRDASGVRYMKAIPMAAQPCALCHGETVAPEVAARIAELYPQDRATGFRPGELRGAVSVSWPGAK